MESTNTLESQTEQFKFINLSHKFITSSSSTTYSTFLTTPSRPHHPINLPPTLRHSTPHLARQHIAKPRKCFLLPLQILIATLDEFDKLARVDIRVARRVDVIDDLGGQLDRADGRVAGVCLCGVGVRGVGLGVG